MARRSKKFKAITLLTALLLNIKMVLKHKQLNGFDFRKSTSQKDLAKKSRPELKTFKEDLKMVAMLFQYGKQKHINDVKAMALELNSHADVEFAEPDFKRYLMGTKSALGYR